LTNSDEANWPLKLAKLTRTRRRQLGLTQLELAELAGCGPAFLYALEKGKPTLRLDKVLDVLSVLGLRIRLEAGKGALTVDEALE
jgi:HTH-type transcriptional regulator/antitoxin HipB